MKKNTLALKERKKEEVTTQVACLSKLENMGIYTPR